MIILLLGLTCDFNHNEGCILEKAELKGDVKLCEIIMKEKSLKDLCYDRVSLKVKDYSICEKIQNQEVKDQCFEDVAIEMLDYSICEKIQNQKSKNHCRSMLYDRIGHF